MPLLHYTSLTPIVKLPLTLLWQIAMKEKLDALSKNHTWDLVTLPPGKSVVGCKWIYKIKTRSDTMLEILEDCIVFLE